MWHNLLAYGWFKIRQLSRSERSLLIQCFWLLPVNVAALRMFGLRRWQALLSIISEPQQKSVEPISVERSHIAARMVRVGSHYSFVASNCLHRSLTLWFLLRRQGIPCDLKIGVGKPDGEFEAHAWIELSGAVLGETAGLPQNFVPFDWSFEPPSAQKIQKEILSR